MRRKFHGGPIYRLANGPGRRVGFISVFVIIILFFGVIACKLLIVPTALDVLQGGDVVRDDAAAIEYTSEKYSEVFSGSESPEKNVLVVCVLDESNDRLITRYSYIGNGFNPDTRHYLSNGDSSKSIKGLNSLAHTYESLPAVLRDLKKNIKEYHRGSGDMGDVSYSKIINETSLKISDKGEQEIEDSITDFALATGISVTCVYAYDRVVYPHQIDIVDVAASVGCIAALAVGVWIVILMVKRLAPSVKEGEGYVIPEEDAPLNMQSNEYSVGVGDVRDKRMSTEKEIKDRTNKKDDRYRRGYDKSRYKKK